MDHTHFVGMDAEDLVGDLGQRRLHALPMAVHADPQLEHADGNQQRPADPGDEPGVPTGEAEGRHPALEQQRRYDLSLLMGLDIPWQPDGLFRDSPDMREATDALLRRELQAAGIGFQTVYGQGGARLQQALRAIGTALGRPLVHDDPALATGRGNWTCDNCSDPECEHRLFTGLLSRV